MSNETIVSPTDQRDVKSVSNNIVKGIQAKANGKTPPDSAKLGNIQGGDQAASPSVDPNVGKEKYVVEGKEIWLTPEQARAYVQKGIAFEPRVSQLGHLQHEVGAFMQKLSSDPMSILTDKRIGLTPEIVLDKVLKSGQISDQLKESVGQWYYENVVAPMKMTPEELEAKENRKQLEEYKNREAFAKDMAIKEENQKRVDLAMAQIKSNIVEAMKESGIPIDSPLGPVMSRRIADVMRLGYFQRKPVTPKEALGIVKSEFKQFQTYWYDVLDEENLVKELGETNAEKVKKYFLKLVKDSGKKIPDQKSTPTPRGERKTINLDDFHEQLAELKKRG